MQFRKKKFVFLYEMKRDFNFKIKSLVNFNEFILEGISIYVA